MTPKGMLPAIVGFAVCLACSSPNTSGGSGGSSGTGESGTTCNDIVLTAPAVSPTYDPNPAPQAVGGTIADGTYFMTAQIVYNTASGPTDDVEYEQIEIAGTTWEGVHRVVGEPAGYPEDYAKTASIDGTALNLYLDCPIQEDTFSAGLFTADATGFTIYGAGYFSAPVVGLVYTKQ